MVIAVIEPDFHTNDHPGRGVFSRTVPISPRLARASEWVAIIDDIDRPKILIVTPHPVIGAGIETMLKLEDLYDVKRVGTLTEGAAEAAAWPADAALVDGVLVEDGWTELGVPCYVLSGDAETGQRLAAQIPSARGWLPKDAGPPRLVEALDKALGIVRVGNDMKGTLGAIVAVLIVLLFIGALGLFLWRFFLS
jgi:CheY-like chemotaxis protein